MVRGTLRNGKDSVPVGTQIDVGEGSNVTRSANRVSFVVDHRIIENCYGFLAKLAEKIST